MLGTEKIVKKNIILNNIMYVAINASGKSIFETEITVFFCINCFVESVCV